jgi:hypothetical protein
MTKAVVKKIAKKPSAAALRRARRFKMLAAQYGADNLEAKIDHAIRESEERRRRVKQHGTVTVAVS